MTATQRLLRKRIQRLLIRLDELERLAALLDKGEEAAPDSVPLPEEDDSGTCYDKRGKKKHTHKKWVNWVARAQDMARVVEKRPATQLQIFLEVKDKWHVTSRGIVRDALARFSICASVAYFVSDGHGNWSLTPEGRTSLLGAGSAKEEEDVPFDLEIDVDDEDDDEEDCGSCDRKAERGGPAADWLARARDLAHVMAHRGATPLQMFNAVKGRWKVGSDKPIKQTLNRFSRCSAVPYFRTDGAGHWTLTEAGRACLLGKDSPLPR